MMIRNYCKECGCIMTQHRRFKFIYYCDNIRCKHYKTPLTKEEFKKVQKRMTKDFKNVGNLCPLCKKGIIYYAKIDNGILGGCIEFTSCSNEKCNAYVKIVKPDVFSEMQRVDMIMSKKIRIPVEVIDYYIDRYGKKIDNPEDDDMSDAVFKTIYIECTQNYVDKWLFYMYNIIIYSRRFNIQ